MRFRLTLALLLSTSVTAASAQTSPPVDHIDPDGALHSLSIGWTGSDLAYKLDGSVVGTFLDDRRAKNGFVPAGASPEISYGSVLVEQTASKAANREITAAIGMYANTGEEVTDPTDQRSGKADKIALYTGTVAGEHAFNVWSYNALTTLPPLDEGVVNKLQGAWSAEFDLNNSRIHAGDVEGPTGLDGAVSASNPLIRGVDITGAGDHRSSAALTVGFLNPNGGWNRGIVVTSAIKSAFSDYSAAATSYDIWGVHGGWGLDAYNATLNSGGFLRGPGNSFIVNGSGAMAINVGGFVSGVTGNAAQIVNQNNAPGAGGLYVSNAWRAATSNVLTVANDNGAISEAPMSTT